MRARFAGRTAVVAGGANGIGESASSTLARDGACVVVADLDGDAADRVAARIAAEGGSAIGIACDVTARADVERTVETAVDRFGALDLLVVSAGITRDNLVHRLTDAEWDGVLRTHLTGSFFCAQAAQRVMVAAQYGRIVFLSSGAARGNPGQANYSAAKAGIEGLTRTLALELGRFGITVNAVAPGFVETRMARAAAERRGVSWDEFKRGVEARIPLGRIAAPAEVADVVAFFCSDDARYVTGQVLSVRGGP